MTATYSGLFRYSEWDGSQDLPSLDAGDVLSALTDDLMNFGDLQHALRNLMQRGMRTPQGDRMQGLRDLLQQLRQQRRQRLDQFDMGGVMEDIRRQLDEIINLERGTIERRMQQAGFDRPRQDRGAEGADEPSDEAGDGAQDAESDGGA